MTFCLQRQLVIKSPSPSISCSSTAPIPMSDASDLRKNGFPSLQTGSQRIGEDVRHFSKSEKLFHDDPASP